MTNEQCQNLCDQKVIAELQEKIDRTEAALRTERCRTASLRHQIKQLKESAMTANV